MLTPADLRPYQQQAVTHVYEHDASLLLCPVGAGKTVIVSTALEELRRDGVINRTLIVAPKRVAQLVWRQEFERWSHLDELDIAVGVGSPKIRRKALSDGDSYVVINYDVLPWLWENYDPEWGFDAIVFDEVSKMKGRGKWWRKTIKQLDRFKVRIGMTGTPTSNHSVADLFPQVYCVDQGERLGVTWTQFRDQYMFKAGPERWDWEPAPGSLEKALEKINDIAFRVKPEDYEKQLPEQVDVDLWCDLEPNTRKIYNRMKREFVVQLEKGEVAADSAGVMVNKLCQIANGFIYGDIEGIGRRLSIEKLRVLEDLIAERQGEPTLIVYRYVADVESLFGLTGGSILGGDHPFCKPPEEAIIEAWNRRHLPVLYLHPAAAGHGLNLQAGGNALVWFGLPWSLELYEQTIGRLRRGGQTSPQVWNYRILARNTIDEDIVRALRENKTIQETVMEGICSKTL